MGKLLCGVYSIICSKVLHVFSNRAPLWVSREILLINSDSGSPSRSATALFRVCPVSLVQHAWCLSRPLMARPLPLWGGSWVSVLKRKTSPHDVKRHALVSSSRSVSRKPSWNVFKYCFHKTIIPSYWCKIFDLHHFPTHSHPVIYSSMSSCVAAFFKPALLALF